MLQQQAQVQFRMQLQGAQQRLVVQILAEQALALRTQTFYATMWSWYAHTLYFLRATLRDQLNEYAAQARANNAAAAKAANAQQVLAIEAAQKEILKKARYAADMATWANEQIQQMRQHLQ